MLLSERLRPDAHHLEGLVGPARALWGKEFKAWRERQRFHVVLWGPPGSGKTTLARLLGENVTEGFVSLSAVRDGVAEIRKAADARPGCVLFIDEIHRLNKAQQDTLLPILEHAVCWVVGATTESPQVSLTPALLSRLRTFYVAPPKESDVLGALARGFETLCADAAPDDARTKAPTAAAEASAGDTQDPVSKRARVQDTILPKIAKMAQGDVRFALNLLENVFHAETLEDEETIFRNTMRAYTAKQHYDFASAMIKSMRGSDPDAALFYAFAALESGEDPLFLLRRCIVFASEDVGNADPQALPLAVSALHAFQMVGMPEGRIPLAQAVTYLASTHKSNRAYVAIDTVKRWFAEASQTPGGVSPPVALTIKGRDVYKYPHSFPNAFVRFDYLPPLVARAQRAQGRAYVPTEFGQEALLRARLTKLWTPGGE